MGFGTYRGRASLICSDTLPSLDPAIRHHHGSARFTGGETHTQRPAALGAASGPWMAPIISPTADVAFLNGHHYALDKDAFRFGSRARGLNRPQIGGQG